MSVAQNVLMVVTSHGVIDATHPTGLWLEEFAVPYVAFRRAGLNIIIASPRGGSAPIDPSSQVTGEQALAWAEASQALETTQPLAQVSGEFDAIFLPGGHGTMFDFPDNPHLQSLIAQIWEAGGIVAAVCHGPAGLVNVVDAEDVPLVAGKTLTAFTNSEERELHLAAKMPFLLETQLRDLGAYFEEKPHWQDHTVRDGRLVTGQNPQSSGSCALAVVALLEAARRQPAPEES